MKNYDQSVAINHNRNWSYIRYHPYRILITGGSGSGKTNVLLNLIKPQLPDIDKKYLYVKDQLESKHQLVINWREKVVTKNLKKENKRRMLIVFDDMIAGMESNKKLSPIATELFLRGKNSIFHLFLNQNHTSKCLKL